MEQTSQQLSGLDAVKDKGGLSKIGRMTPYQIIERDIEKFKLDLDPKKTYAALLKMTQQPNFRIVRANDSILLIDNKGDGTGEGIMFTADSAKTFVKSLIHFNKALQTGGFHEMSFTSSGLNIEPLLKKAKLKYTIAHGKMKVGSKTIDGAHITVYES
jgi:hypothetical protein